MWVPAILLAALVALSPLALGSNRPLPWAYNAVGAGVCLMLVIAIALARPDRLRLDWRPIRVPVALALLVLVWIGVQAAPIGIEGLVHPNWRYSGDLLGSAPAGSISVDPALTLQAAMRFATVLSVFLAACMLGRDRRIAAMLVWTLLAAGAAYAVYGLLGVSLSLDRILWYEQRATGYLTSTFINRNSAATYFGLASIMAFALLQRQLRRSLQTADGASWHVRIAAAAHRLAGPLGLTLGLFALVFCALLVTGSRAGIAFTVAGLATLILLQLLRSRMRGRGAAGAGLARFGYVVVLLAVIVALADMAGARLAGRLIAGGLGQEARLTAYADTAKAIADNALVGTGYGTFEAVYPLYRSAQQITSIWDKAHNDYLELFLGLGVPAALALLAALAMIVARCAKGAFARRRDAHYPMVAVAASVLVGLHALVDFSLQIEAVAMTYATILGIGTAQATTTGR
ncbi:O-antigen ligase family protein [Kaustia mangrovi]|uniref:O-antigen ligase family protein n=1 Tax=Kaustia mangrovi TaxID=2593653 RepID=A0A7S8C5B2_9HYPH|nr:O-antigen ligase family protein [Kaustia mangrovi]QPC43685.1 O-antigen ligase family protein [Kaustia mangrovi]